MTEPWVVFHLGGQRYCTEATQIREIITYREPNPVPVAPPGVEGIISVRDEKITLFSGASLINHANTAPPADGHIILLEDEDGMFAISVDGVDGIVQLDPDQIDSGCVTRDKAVLGTVPHNEELITAVSLLTFGRNAISNQDITDRDTP